MYPALPRWSEAANGGLPTHQPHEKLSFPLHTSSTQAEGTSPEVFLPNPSTRVSPQPTAQVKRAGRSGQLFVNHNAVPVAAAAPQTAALPVSGPSSDSQSGARGGRAPAPTKQQPLRGGGPLPLNCANKHNITATGSPGVSDAPYEMSRPPYVSKRRGLARGTTVVNAVELRHCSDAPLSLGVEGVQTGEEVLVESTAARRRSSSNTGGSPLTGCHNPQDHVQVPQLKRQLEKANASVKSLTAANRRQKLECDALKAEWAVQLAECEARLRVALTHRREREGLLSQHISQTVKLYNAEVQRASRLHQSAVDAHAADKEKWEAELASLRRKMEEAKATAITQAANSSAAAALQAQVEQLKAELEALRKISAEKQYELETALSDTQSSLNKTTIELHECRQAQLECNYIVQQCRLFIRQVCQPGFSVVKGPSLEPVEKDRPEPTGFVLVPLLVLLHGYTLLPEGDRQEVIDHYDKVAKALH